MADQSKLVTIGDVATVFLATPAAFFAWLYFGDPTLVDLQIVAPMGGSIALGVKRLVEASPIGRRLRGVRVWRELAALDNQVKSGLRIRHLVWLELAMLDLKDECLKSRHGDVGHLEAHQLSDRLADLVKECKNLLGEDNAITENVIAMANSTARGYWDLRWFSYMETHCALVDARLARIGPHVRDFGSRIDEAALVSIHGRVSSLRCRPLNTSSQARIEQLEGQVNQLWAERADATGFQGPKPIYTSQSGEDDETDPDTRRALGS